MFIVSYLNLKLLQNWEREYQILFLFASFDCLKIPIYKYYMNQNQLAKYFCF